MREVGHRGPSHHKRESRVSEYVVYIDYEIEVNREKDGLPQRPYRRPATIQAYGKGPAP